MVMKTNKEIAQLLLDEFILSDGYGFICTSLMYLATRKEITEQERDQFYDFLISQKPTKDINPEFMVDSYVPGKHERFSSWWVINQNGWDRKIRIKFLQHLIDKYE